MILTHMSICLTHHLLDNRSTLLKRIKQKKQNPGSVLWRACCRGETTQTSHPDLLNLPCDPPTSVGSIWAHHTSHKIKLIQRPKNTVCKLKKKTSFLNFIIWNRKRTNSYRTSHRCYSNEIIFTINPRLIPTDNPNKTNRYSTKSKLHRTKPFPV